MIRFPYQLQSERAPFPFGCVKGREHKKEPNTITCLWKPSLLILILILTLWWYRQRLNRSCWTRDATEYTAKAVDVVPDLLTNANFRLHLPQQHGGVDEKKNTVPAEPDDRTTTVRQCCCLMVFWSHCATLQQLVLGFDQYFD